MVQMLFPWLKIGGSGLVALTLMLSTNPKDLKSFIPFNISAIALASYAGVKLRQLEKFYSDKEREEDMLAAMKDTQAEEQLQFLSSAAERKRSFEEADKQTERQLKLLQQTAPLFSDVLNITGRNGAIERMALGMLQNGEPLGNVLLAASEAEMQLETAKLAAQFNTRQLELQTQVAHQQLKNADVVFTPSTTAVIEPPKLSKIDGLTKAATVVGINTQCLRVDIAPSYERLVFSVKTEDFNLLPKFKAASKLALGISEKEDLPFYIYAPEQIAVEVPLPPQQRTYYDFPTRQWNSGERLIVLGQSLDGEVIVNLASEDTPQILVVGVTGSGKSNFLRAAAYCLLMQGARVDVCGGKVSDYEDFAERFPTITMNDMGKTFEFVGEYFNECDRRNSMTKAQLDLEQPWILLIDEYKGTVPLEDALRKAYDQQLCEVGRRGRGLKIHIVVGLQRGAKRSKEDPQGLPPDLRDNLPCRIAFRCVDATSGRMILMRRGEAVTSLQGRGDGIVQSGLLDQRFQAYRFDTIPA
ncbi:FtsK/SpoIIIE domain-containing protein (plasmid) [Nostoc sp. UHCC 0302]|uniref:FtsK/SpoIIIE domain-containing protein n=1 Tax=Nostoc sp. UHCC 0302 TaxID=3134896 RepID=UPI00311C9920